KDHGPNRQSQYAARRNIDQNELMLGYNRRASGDAKSSTKDKFNDHVLMNALASDTNSPATTFQTAAPWDYTRELLLALVLLLVSQLFALTFGRLVRWELAAAHAKPLEAPQLYRCF